MQIKKKEEEDKGFKKYIETVLLSLSFGLYACINVIIVFCINLDMYK